MELLDDESTIYDYTFKIVLLWNSSIGKSILSFRIKSKSYFEFKKNYNSDYVATVGFEFITKYAKLNNKIIRFQIWDCCGNEIYKDLIRQFCKNAEAILIFYDYNDRYSFERAKFYFHDVEMKRKDILYFLIRIRYELKNKENKDFVSDEEALEFANEKNAYFCHISAFEKYETGIYELFKLLIEKLLDNYNKHRNFI